MKLITFQKLKEGEAFNRAHVVIARKVDDAGKTDGWHLRFSSGKKEVRTYICPNTFQMVTTPTIVGYLYTYRRTRHWGWCLFSGCDFYPI